MDYLNQVPSEYKCSRCHRDVRKNSNKDGCICCDSHPRGVNKSGDNIYRTELEYQGVWE